MKYNFFMIKTLKKVFYTIIVFTNLGLILAGCRGLVL